MSAYRLDDLLAIVKEHNPAAYTFCQKISEVASIIDDVHDQDKPVDAERLQLGVLELTKLTHTDEWAKPRLSTIFTMWSLAYLYWQASNKMAKSQTRGVIKDQFNSILIWAIAEKAPPDFVVNVIANFPYEQT